jgi:hypothetical protein
MLTLSDESVWHDLWNLMAHKLIYWSLQLYFCLSLLFNDAVSCYVDVASVVDEWMSMEHWWNDTERGKIKVPGDNLSQCDLATTNPIMIWPRVEPWPLLWDRSLDTSCPMAAVRASNFTRPVPTSHQHSVSRDFGFRQGSILQDAARRQFVGHHRRFERVYSFRFKGQTCKNRSSCIPLPLKKGLLRCIETSVVSYNL